MALTITTSLSTGVRLGAADTPVSVWSTGTVDCAGSFALYGDTKATWSIGNAGVLRSAGVGVDIVKYGTVANGAGAEGATIEGVTAGVRFSRGAGTVANEGTVRATGTAGYGLQLSSGGSVSNGIASHAALIDGGGVGVLLAKGGTIANDGTILGGSIGASLTAGGTLANGSGNATALIRGTAFGVSIKGSSVVTNTASIAATGTTGIALSTAGGTLTNGVGGVITGGAGGVYANGAGNILNLGSITGTGGVGVSLTGAGTVMNGSATQTGASITGGTDGVQLRCSPATATDGLVNFGLVTGGGNGVTVLAGKGSIVNGSAQVTTAAITGGADGVTLAAGGSVLNFGTISGAAIGVALKGVGAITNFGSIDGSAGYGVSLAGSATVTNGSTSATAARITGAYEGIRITASPTSAPNAVLNDGTVVGTSGSGVDVMQGGTVVNGASADVTARIEGAVNGVIVNGLGTVINYGTIVGTNALASGMVFPPPPQTPFQTPPGSYGINLRTGGRIVNGSASSTAATVYGTFVGAQVHGGKGTVQNYGTLAGGLVGVYTWLGGTVVNGSEADRAALIRGSQFGTWNTYPGCTIRNFGTITASAGSGVDLASGGHPGAAGSLQNGSVTDTQALIAGSVNGVTTVNGATVSNYGTMTGTSGIGCYVTAGGVLTNGSLSDTRAVIAGYTMGAAVKGEFTGGTTKVLVNTLRNFGTITGQIVGAGMLNGGLLTNGATNAQAALIQAGSGSGVALQLNGTATKVVAPTVANFGTIRSAGGYGISAACSGLVTNGAIGATSACIMGSVGIGCFGAPLTVTNDGTVSGNAGAGIWLASGGVLTNGEAGVAAALVSGQTYGIGAQGGALTVTNTGTIVALGAGGIGAFLGQGGIVTNGSNALIQGDTAGVRISGPSVVSRMVTNNGTIVGATGVDCFAGLAPATVANSGTIVGTGGTAVLFGMASDRLVLDPGATFVGTVVGGGGSNTIELRAGAGAGSLGGLGSSFTGFAAITVDTTANWTLTGANVAQTLDQNGTLTLAAGASLDVTGAVGSKSTGGFVLASNATLEVASMTGAGASIDFAGGAGAELSIDVASAFGLHVGGTTYVGPMLQNFGANDSIDLTNVASAGATLAYDSASGLLQVTAGSAKLATLSFADASLGSGSFHAGDDGHGHLLLTRG